MSWLKGLIFEDDGTEQKRELDPKKPLKAQVSDPENNSTPPVKTYSDTPVYSYNSAAIGVSPEAMAHFYELIKASNLPGPDYYEFHEMLKVMSAIPDEALKYKTVMAGLTAQSATKDIIINSAGQYIQLVKKSVADFEVQYNQTVKAQIGDKRRLIEVKAKEIEDLTKKLATLNQEINQLSSEANQAESVLSQKKDLFLNAGKAVVAEIEGELQKINSYL